MKKSHSIWGIISKFIKNKDGSTLPFVALAIPVVMGMVGLGTDASLWVSQKIALQTAADASVIAAGWEIAQESEDYMDTVALEEAQNNGYDSSANGELLLQIVDQTADTVTLSVSLTQDAQTFFSRIVFQDPVRVTAQAQALITNVDGKFCVLALDESNPGALTTSGTATINMPSCGLAINSNDPAALNLTGDVSIDVNNVRIAGNYDTAGNSVSFEYGSMHVGTTPLDDPYADLEVPSFSGCDENNASYNSTSTLSPGVYCNGINISGDNAIDFEPGVYIIDGGDFKVTGSGALLGEGVTFILTGSGNNYAQVDISGSRTVEFSAPQEGEDWEGITFFQDRNAPQRHNLQNKLVGTSEIIMNGVAYFPSQGLWFGGDNTLTGGDSPCTLLIAKTVTLAGNPGLGNNCDGYGIAPVQEPNVKLIL